ncbi:proline-rich receptor-like protein kinase PERK13 [Arachis duranensis]|uniref:Proline-rich receptor-like protein kinase PERK13 n=1 Tax=Arachis duranensis TaxID=130453 RepID=A0A6P4D4Z9_ARADU|nr:proline-rich receptor-like protein kinase PERK13 [Arachis duranensis]
MGQLSKQIPEGSSNTFPDDIVVNLREECKAITLISGQVAIPTPKKSPRRILAVVEDDDNTEIAGNVQVVKHTQISGEPQPMEEAHQENNLADVVAQNEDSFTVPQQIPNPAPSSSHEARQISQPPPTPVQPDEPPSSQSQPSQPPVEYDQQPSHTHGTDPVPPSKANVSEASQPPIEHDQQPFHTDGSDQVPPSEANFSEPIAPEQLTQYIPHPYRNPLSQSIPESVPPSDSNRTPQNNEIITTL